MYAGITSVYWPAARTNDIYQAIREVAVPLHEEERSQGLQGAFFFTNPDTGHGLGISLWETPEKLLQIHGATTREMSREMRDARTAPTDYTRRRAKYIDAMGGVIASSDWYELVGHVPLLSTAADTPKVQVRMPKWSSA